MPEFTGSPSGLPALFLCLRVVLGSPLMDSLSKKNKLLALAVQSYPKLVFQDWLRLRRRSAKVWYPGYKSLSRERQVICLDRAVTLTISLN